MTALAIRREHSFQISCSASVLTRNFPAVDEVLINSTYRAHARKPQRKIVEANGLSVAADVIEEALGARRKGQNSQVNNGAAACDNLGTTNS